MRKKIIMGFGVVMLATFAVGVFASLGFWNPKNRAITITEFSEEEVKELEKAFGFTLSDNVKIENCRYVSIQGTSLSVTLSGVTDVDLFFNNNIMFKPKYCGITSYLGHNDKNVEAAEYEGTHSSEVSGEYPLPISVYVFSSDNNDYIALVTSAATSKFPFDSLILRKMVGFKG